MLQFTNEFTVYTYKLILNRFKLSEKTQPIDSLVTKTLNEILLL